MSMKIVKFETRVCENDMYTQECNVDITCKCNFDDIKQLYAKQLLGSNYPDCFITIDSGKSSETKTSKKPPRFGGYFTLPDGKEVYIKRVIYSKPAVIVFWSDDVRTRSTCDNRDVWNPEFGLTLSIMKRFTSTEQLNLLFKDWCSEEIQDEYVSINLKDVRKNQKSS